MKNKEIITAIFFASAMLFSLVASAQKERGVIREGNKIYQDGAYAESETQYLKALSIDSTQELAQFNLGDALYEQGRYEDAADRFAQVAGKSGSDDIKAKAHYNHGNALLEQQKYEESIEAYKRALRLNPDAHNAKYNLSYALEMLKKQQDQQDQDKQDDEQQEQEKQDQDSENEQDQQDDGKGEEDKKDQPDNGKENGEPDKEGKEQQPAEGAKISQEEAEQILKALESQEKEVQRKMLLKQQKESRPVKTEKEW
ncbi:MAG: tetratricopeptide repeat protein [Bacteroidia bacterium]